MAGFNPNYSNSQISSNWLAGVADNTPISMIAYMGSHNSAGWQNARDEMWYQVQNQRDKNLTDQFNAGNRHFSLRYYTPKSWNDNTQLLATHQNPIGTYSLISTLPEHENALVRALAMNPSEFILLDADIYENSKPIDNYKQGQDFYSTFLEPFTTDSGEVAKNQDGSPKIDLWASKSKLWSEEIFSKYGLSDLPLAHKQQLLGKPMVWRPKLETKYLKDPANPSVDYTYIDQNGKPKKIALDFWVAPTVGELRGKFNFGMPWLFNNLPSLSGSDTSKIEWNLINQLYPGQLRDRKDSSYEGINRGKDGWFSSETLKFIDNATGSSLSKIFPKGLYQDRFPEITLDENGAETTKLFWFDYLSYEKQGFKDDAGRVRDQIPTIVNNVKNWGPEFLGRFTAYASGSYGTINTRFKEAGVVFNENGLYKYFSDSNPGDIQGEFFADYVAWDKDNFGIPAAYVADKNRSIDLMLERQVQQLSPRAARKDSVTGQTYRLRGYVDDQSITNFFNGDKYNIPIEIRLVSLDSKKTSPFIGLTIDPITNSYKIPVFRDKASRPSEFFDGVPNGLVYNREYKADSFLIETFVGDSVSLVRYGAPRPFRFDQPSGLLSTLPPLVSDL